MNCERWQAIALCAASRSAGVKGTWTVKYFACGMSMGGALCAGLSRRRAPSRASQAGPERWHATTLIEPRDATGSAGLIETSRGGRLTALAVPAVALTSSA